MTADEIKSVLIGATIARVDAHGSTDDAELFAIQLTTGEIFMFQGGHSGEVGMERDDRPDVWFKEEVE